MSAFVEPFEVISRLADQAYEVRFSHLWNGIATRHSDTVDAKFFVNGKGVVVGVSHVGMRGFREQAGRYLTDRETSYLAATFLSERLEQEDERPLYDVSSADVARLTQKIGLI